MIETYITKIQVAKSGNIQDLTIPLSDKERSHLIITGKNGSGKTTLLNDLFKFLKQIDNGDYQYYLTYLDAVKSSQKKLVQLTTLPQTDQIEKRKKSIEAQINRNKLTAYGGTDALFSNCRAVFRDVRTGDFLIAFFDAKRHIDFKTPSGITKVNLKKKYDIDDRANRDFIQYLVNLKADRSFAKDDGEKEVVQKIDEWFTRFENRLQSLFQSPKLQLKFNRKNYNFEIIEDGKLPFGFNTLADGYSAIISIAAELLLRMEGHGAKAYDLEGIVLIDEIETHLHVDLQKKVLPFLTGFFPKIQFIVTTHSPFVLSSVSNAVVCDLEISLVTGDLSAYSYDALIESYFNSDKYSEEIKQKILHYEKLSSLSRLSDKERDDLRQLRNYFAHVPKYLSRELMVKLQQIELQNLPKKDKK